MTFVLRTESQPEILVGAVREAVKSVDANQPLSAAESMDRVIANSVAPRRFQMMLLGLFALLASVLAAIGIYGVIIYSCSQRTREFGIRIALGAGRQDVLSMVVRQGIKLALMGVGLGIGGALALTRLLSSLLYGVKPTDPLTFFVASFVLTVVALIASYIPARRAGKVDPTVALRHE
jgi:putative ABC transport system permease protein